MKSLVGALCWWGARGPPTLKSGPEKCAFHVTFDLDLENTLDAGLPVDHRVQVWWRFGQLFVRSDLRKSLQTDGRTDRPRTPRHCISILGTRMVQLPAIAALRCNRIRRRYRGDFFPGGLLPGGSFARGDFCPGSLCPSPPPNFNAYTHRL